VAVGAALSLDRDSADRWRRSLLSCLVTMCCLFAQGLVP
jgi:hypothetical protein